MARLRTLVALLALAALLSGCGSYTFKGTLLDPASPAPDFTLTDQDGRPFRLSEQRGSVVVLFFGFTNCPDVCPAALADLAAVRRKLGGDGEKVRVALITVDPERDTQQALGRYVRIFDPTFLGLRGTEAELAPVMKAYGVFAARRDLPDSALKYTMDHSAFTYVIDQAGRWRLLFSPETTIDDMASDLRHLIRSEGA